MDRRRLLAGLFAAIGAAPVLLAAEEAEAQPYGRGPPRRRRRYPPPPPPPRYRRRRYPPRPRY